MLKKHIAIFIIGAILSIYAAEILLRFLGYSEVWPDIFVYDQNLFLKLRNKLDCEHKTDEYDVRIVTNSIGCRSHECAPNKKPGSFRIFFLGDSITFGQGVNSEEAFPELIQERLNSKENSPRFEVINCGVPGWTTYQESEFFKEDILKLHPDLVICVIFLGDDFYQNGLIYRLMHNKNASIIMKREICLSKIRGFIFSAFGAYNKYLPQKLRLTRLPRLLVKSLWENFLYINDPVYNLNRYKEIKDRIQQENILFESENIISLGLIRKLSEEAHHNNIKIIFVLADIHLNGNKRRDMVRQILLDYFSANKYPFIDLISALKNRYPSMTAFSNFPADGHMNADGHKIMAEIIMGSPEFRKALGN